MPVAYHFTQPCPTCGRQVRIAISYLGRTVACQHCQAEFDAFDDGEGDSVPPETTAPLMERVEAMLRQTSDSGTQTNTPTSAIF